MADSKPSATGTGDVESAPAWQLRERLLPQDRTRIERITASSGFFSAEELGVALEVFDQALAGQTSGQDSGYRYWLAEAGGGVVGYACYGPIALTEASCDLYWIAVDDAQRGSGVGRYLMARVETSAAARGCRQLYAETSGREQYRPTRRFYERLGYECVATMPDFYAPGDAKVVYVKRLG